MFTKFEENVSVHQSLADEPNIDNGLSAEGLKKKWDEPAEKLKTALNNLIGELADENAAKNIGIQPLTEADTSGGDLYSKLVYLLEAIQNVTLGAIPDGTITPSKLEESYAKSITRDLMIKTGTISHGATIPQTEGYDHYMYFVSANTFLGTDFNIMRMYSGDFFRLGTTTAVDQATRVVTAQSAYGAYSSGDTFKPTYVSETANYIEIAWKEGV